MFSLIETLNMQQLRWRKRGTEYQGSITVTDESGQLHERQITICAMGQKEAERLAERYQARWQAQVLATKLQRSLGLIGKKSGAKKGRLNVFKVHSYQQALRYALQPLGVSHGKLLKGALANFSAQPVDKNQQPNPQQLTRRLKNTRYHTVFYLGFIALSIAAIVVGRQYQHHHYLLFNPHYLFALFSGFTGLAGVYKSLRDSKRLHNMRRDMSRNMLHKKGK
jgi:hypothetical protein